MLLDKAITTFRERRAAVMNQLEEDVNEIKWSKKEIAWIEKKIADLKRHKADCTTRLKEVEETLEKFGAVPDEKAEDYADTQARSVVPLVQLSQTAKKHCSLNTVRCLNHLAESNLEFERGFNMSTKFKPEQSEADREKAASLPGTTRYELAQAIRRLPPLQRNGR